MSLDLILLACGFAVLALVVLGRRTMLKMGHRARTRTPWILPVYKGGDVIPEERTWFQKWAMPAVMLLLLIGGGMLSR